MNPMLHAPFIAMNPVLHGLLACTALAPSLPFGLRAQEAARPVSGVVRTEDGEAIAGANVFLLETLEGALTGDEGRFSIVTGRPGAVTLVVRRLGFLELRRAVSPDERAALEVVLQAEPTVIAAIDVRAGRYAGGAGSDAVLTPIDVVSTPGAAANINQAIQTLPGVQSVDEGTGLYVRGGDYIETRTLVNGAPLYDLYTYQAPAGTFVGTVNPFLLEDITFSSGAFGARYGNALSGLVDLETAGRPERASVVGTVGLAAVSLLGALPLSSTLGVRAAANLFDTRLLFDVNDAPREYSPPPRGGDLSGSVIWNYRPAGELKLFAIEQRTALGIGVEDPSHAGEYALDIDGDFAVATWHDVLGDLAPSLTVSYSGARRTQQFGAFRLRTRVEGARVAGSVAWTATDRWLVRTGAEWERSRSAFDGTVPESGDDVAPGARVRVAGAEFTGERTGIFAEAEWDALERLMLVGGIRTDHSTLTDRRTIDPRISAAYALAPAVSLTAAWGIYHQVASPLFFESAAAAGHPPPLAMRATHTVLGAQVGSGGDLLRVEAYRKRYRDLEQLGRDYETVAGGVGTAKGVDVFLKATTPWGLSGQFSYSYVRSRRTDAETGLLAPAPFEVPHTVAASLEYALGTSWFIGMAVRRASGRPVTPVMDASYDPERDVWVPRYGAPGSERLPDFRRIDLTVTHLRTFGDHVQAVFFAALQNLTDHVNVYAYRYSSDYGTQFPVPGIYNRSVYLGASVSIQ